MKNKLSNLLEFLSEETVGMKSAHVLSNLSKAFTITGNLPQGIKIADAVLQANQESEENEYLIYDLYFTIASVAIFTENKLILDSLLPHIQEDSCGTVLSGVLDLKLKKYDSAFRKLAKADPDNYEFFGQITNLIEEVLPKSTADFPIDFLIENLPNDSLKTLVFGVYYQLACNEPDLVDENSIKLLIEKCAGSDAPESYWIDYKTLLLTHQGHYTDAIEYATKTCDLREIGLLDQITTILIDRDNFKTAISTAILAVEKSERIDWDHYCQGDELFAKSQYGMFLVERLITLSKLYHTTDQSLKEAETIDKAIKTINKMPVEDYYGDMVLTQYGNLINLSLDLKNINLLKSIVESCTPLALDEDNITSVYLFILDAANKHPELLKEDFLEWMQDTINVDNLPKGEAIQVNIRWVKLMISNNELGKAQELANSVIRYKNIEHHQLIGIAPLHFKLANMEEIKDLFTSIGQEASSSYLLGVAKDAANPSMKMSNHYLY